MTTCDESQLQLGQKGKVVTIECDAQSYATLRHPKAPGVDGTLSPSIVSDRS